MLYEVEHFDLFRLTLSFVIAMTSVLDAAFGKEERID